MNARRAAGEQRPVILPLEEVLDQEVARRAKADPRPPVPWDAVKARLGL